MLFILYFVLLRLKERTDGSGSHFKPTTIAVVITCVSLCIMPKQFKLDPSVYSSSYLLATAHVALMLYELIMGFTRTSTDLEEQYYFTYGTPQAIAMVKNMIYVIVVSTFSYSTKALVGINIGFLERDRRRHRPLAAVYHLERKLLDISPSWSRYCCHLR